MTFEIGAVLAILAVSVVLFVTNWIRPDIVSIFVLLAVVATGVLPAEEAVSGFSSEAVLAIAGLLVIGAGLVRSGVVRWIADRVDRFARKGNKRLILTTSTLPGILSGLISDVATVSLFIPLVIRLARRNEVPRTHLLMPLAMAALIGGNLTLIGASQNLVVDSLIQQAGLPGLSFFELLPIGAALLIGFSVYTLLLGRHLLPEEKKQPDSNGAGSRGELIETYHLWNRLWEVAVQKRSTFVDKTIVDIHSISEFGLIVVAVVQDDEIRLPENNLNAITAGDVLLLVGQKERVDQLIEHEGGLELLGHPETKEEFPASGAELSEVVVPPRSPAIGKTLIEINLREQSGLTGVALWREGQPIRTDVAQTALCEGDALLLYGPQRNARGYDPKPDFLWLHPPHKEEAPRELRHLAPWAALVLAAVVLGAAFNLVPIPVAALAGAAAMMLLGVLKPSEAYESVEWRTVVLIGGMYSLGLALESSGAAALLSGFLASSLGSLGPLAVLAGVLVVSMLLTQVLHGAAVAVMMTPVVLDTAVLMDINVLPLAVAVIVGTASNYLLPVGHPAPLLVQKPGKYEQKDYLRFGAGLAGLTILISVVVLPIVWPF